MFFMADHFSDVVSFHLGLPELAKIIGNLSVVSIKKFVQNI